MGCGCGLCEEGGGASGGMTLRGTVERLRGGG